MSFLFVLAYFLSHDYFKYISSICYLFVLCFSLTKGLRSKLYSSPFIYRQYTTTFYISISTPRTQRTKSLFTWRWDILDPRDNIVPRSHENWQAILFSRRLSLSLTCMDQIFDLRESAWAKYILSHTNYKLSQLCYQIFVKVGFPLSDFFTILTFANFKKFLIFGSFRPIRAREIQ